MNMIILSFSCKRLLTVNWMISYFIFDSLQFEDATIRFFYFTFIQSLEVTMVTFLALADELLTTRVGVEVTKFFKPRLGIICTNHLYLLVQSQQCKEQSSLQNLFKVNYKYTRKTPLTHSAHCSGVSAAILSKKASKYLLGILSLVNIVKIINSWCVGSDRNNLDLIHLLAKKNCCLSFKER